MYEVDELKELHAGMLKIYDEGNLKLSADEKTFVADSSEGKGSDYRITYMLQHLMHYLALENLGLDSKTRGEMISNFLKLKKDICDKNFRPDLIFEAGNKWDFERALAESMIKRITGKGKLTKIEEEMAKNIGVAMDSLAAVDVITQIPKQFSVMVDRKMRDGIFCEGSVLYISMADFLKHQYDYYSDSSHIQKAGTDDLPKVIKSLSNFEGNFWDMPVEDGKISIDGSYKKLESGNVKPGFQRSCEFDDGHGNKNPKSNEENDEKKYYMNAKAKVISYQKSETFSPEVTADDIILSYIKKERIKEKFNVADIDLNSVSFEDLIIYLNTGLKFGNDVLDTLSVEKLIKIKESSKDLYEKLYSSDYFKYLIGKYPKNEGIYKRIAMVPNSSFSMDFLIKTFLIICQKKISFCF